MKKFILLISLINNCFLSEAQLYINCPVTIENGVTVFTDDVIMLASSSAVTTNGILQTTNSITSNPWNSPINTGTTGFVICPVPSGTATYFDIGNGSNNQIKILHGTGTSVIFKIAVRDNIYQNPQTSTTQITSNGVNKTWVIQPLSGSVNTVITLGWNAGDELASFARSNCGMSRWQSGTTTAWSYLNGTAAATNTGTIPAYSRTSPSMGLAATTYYFGIGGVGSALPVTLISFDAIKSDQDVILKWATAQEINSDYFELERSVNGSQLTLNGWENIAKVKAAGNSNTEKTYEFKDLAPFSKLKSSMLFYRLKLLNMDGSFHYADAKKVELQNNPNINDLVVKLYPNPNNGLLNISFETKEPKTILINLYDARGINIARDKYLIQTDKQAFQFNTSQLAPGAYLIYLTDESNAAISKQKLIIY